MRAFSEVDKRLSFFKSQAGACGSGGPRGGWGLHRGRMQCVEGRGGRKGVWKLIRREATNDAYIAFLFEKKARGGFEEDQ